MTKILTNPPEGKAGERLEQNQKHLISFFLGTSVSKIPVVAKLPLDLYRLYHVVQNLGGFAQVQQY